MVYKGPSKGCYTCRKRRVKCDEKRPQCGNCIKRKQACPGYRDLFDAVHKDETRGICEKSSTKRTKKTESPAADSIECLSDSSLDFASEWSLQTEDVAMVLQPSRSKEMESLCYFFTNYVNIPRDPSTNIFIEHILPVYLNAAPDSALAEAIHAVAINITQMWTERHVDSYLARDAYARSVSLLTGLLQDPEHCKSDETLATVFMLDFYDSLNQRFVHFVDAGTHQQGAVALLKHRGKDNFKNPLSQRLFNAMRSRHVNYCLQAGKRVQLDPELIADETAVLPSAKLDLLNVELADLHALAREAPEDLNLSMSEFYQTILDKALAVEKKFQAWKNSLPKSWQPVTIPASELHPTIREAGVYENMCEVYSSLAVSHVNNTARGSHVETIRMIALCLRGLEDLGVPTDPTIMPYIELKTQEIVDRFCASIPYHLGNRTTLSFPHEFREYPQVPAELRRLANYVDPFGNEVEMTMEDHMRAAAAIGGWFLMTPLAGFLRAPIFRTGNIRPGPLMRKIRPGQLDWIRGQLQRIKKIYIFPTHIEGSATNGKPAIDFKNSDWTQGLKLWPAQAA